MKKTLIILMSVIFVLALAPFVSAEEVEVTQTIPSGGTGGGGGGGSKYFYADFYTPRLELFGIGEVYRNDVDEVRFTLHGVYNDKFTFLDRWTGRNNEPRFPAGDYYLNSEMVSISDDGWNKQYENLFNSWLYFSVENDTCFDLNYVMNTRYCGDFMVVDIPQHFQCEDNVWITIIYADGRVEKYDIEGNCTYDPDIGKDIIEFSGCFDLARRVELLRIEDAGGNMHTTFIPTYEDMIFGGSFSFSPYLGSGSDVKFTESFEHHNWLYKGMDGEIYPGETYKKVPFPLGPGKYLLESAGDDYNGIGGLKLSMCQKSQYGWEYCTGNISPNDPFPDMTFTLLEEKEISIVFTPLYQGDFGRFWVKMSRVE